MKVIFKLSDTEIQKQVGDNHHLSGSDLSQEWRMKFRINKDDVIGFNPFFLHDDFNSGCIFIASSFAITNHKTQEVYLSILTHEK